MTHPDTSQIQQLKDIAEIHRHLGCHDWKYFTHSVDVDMTYRYCSACELLEYYHHSNRFVASDYHLYNLRQFASTSDIHKVIASASKAGIKLWERQI